MVIGHFFDKNAKNSKLTVEIQNSQVRYEYYNNCNFTEVGEPFAEQPYAVAVQQGSHLQEEISKVILELQKVSLAVCYLQIECCMMWVFLCDKGSLL